VLLNSGLLALQIVKELGLKPREPAESLRDMARTLIALNLASPQALDT
jgi:hypothetical protein